MNEIMNNILAATAMVGLFTGILIEGIKRAEVVSNRVLPLLSLALGMITGFVLAVGFDQAVPIFVAAGFLGGAIASGLYDSMATVIDLLKNLLKGE